MKELAGLGEFVNIEGTHVELDIFLSLIHIAHNNSRNVGSHTLRNNIIYAHVCTARCDFLLFYVHDNFHL